MKKNVLVIAALVATLGTISSCKKETTTPTTPDNTAPTPSTPTDADGAFVAVNTITYQTVTIPFGNTTIVNKIELGAASAWVGKPDAIVDAGTVKCQDSVLTKQASNVYVYVPKSATGIEKSNQTKWDVSGAGSVTGFTYTHSATFPSVDSIDLSGNDVNTGGEFVLKAKGFVSSSDSVIYVIAGPKGNVVKVQGPNVSSCTFTAAEMATVGTGDNQGILQIAPYRWTSSTQNGKKYYFIKETCVSKIVNLK